MDIPSYFFLNIEMNRIRSNIWTAQKDPKMALIVKDT